MYLYNRKTHVRYTNQRQTEAYNTSGFAGRAKSGIMMKPSLLHCPPFTAVKVKENKKITVAAENN